MGLVGASGKPSPSQSHKPKSNVGGGDGGGGKSKMLCVCVCVRAANGGKKRCIWYSRVGKDGEVVQEGGG